MTTPTNPFIADHDPNKDGKDQLRKTLSRELQEHLNGDIFWAGSFFDAMAAAGELKPGSTDPDAIAATFKLVKLVVGSHQDEVKRLVGSDPKAVSEFLAGVIADNGTRDPASGTTLGKD